MPITSYAESECRKYERICSDWQNNFRSCHVADDYKIIDCPDNDMDVRCNLKCPRNMGCIKCDDLKNDRCVCVSVNGDIWVWKNIKKKFVLEKKGEKRHDSMPSR